MTVSTLLKKYDPTDRKIRERVFHAILFEIIATAICAPLFAYLMDKSLLEMGSLTLMFATIAVMWNFVYNFLFDRITRSFIKRRGFVVRAIHALIFETGLILITVPLGAFWLNVTIMEALVMNIGIILFFLPYTMIFNWIYDTFRRRLWLKRAMKDQ